MYLKCRDSQDLDLDPDFDDDGLSSTSSSCSQGHRSSLNLHTQQGGSICLLCFSNLLSNPLSPTIHVSYALSQLSRALSQPLFLHSLLTFHPHFLTSPLVNALSSFDDEPIASHLTQLILSLSSTDHPSLYGDFLSRISDRLSSGSLAWSFRQLHMLHCLGALLNCLKDDPYAHIKDIHSLISNLAAGLKLPSEDIRGEIVFVLYKLSILQSTSGGGDGIDTLISFCPKLLYLLGEALMKTENDDVRLNCVALLTVLARRHLFTEACAYDTSSMNFSGGRHSSETETGTKGSSLCALFAEAIKGPLLSSNSQVQINTLDLLFHYLASMGTSGEHIQILVEENIADYVFEVLRLSEYKDPAVKTCLRVLDLLSTAEEVFKLRLVVGFSTLIPVLQYIAEVPFHAVQFETLKLIFKCVSECPGTVSSSQLEELVLVLTRMLKKHSDGEMGVLPETFIMACLVFVALIRSPSRQGVLDLSKSMEDAIKHATLTCLFISERNTEQTLHFLYLLKEAHAFSQEGNSTNSNKLELKSCILDICKTHLLPWLLTDVNEMEEEIVLGLLETFHSIFLLHVDADALEVADTMISSSWFSFSYGCLGLFPGQKMKYRIYLLFSSLVDVLLGDDSGHTISAAALHLPSDPIDLLCLLGQKSTKSSELASCQSAALLILYTSSLYDERLADEKLVLASLEQYVLVNSSELLDGTTDNMTVIRLVNLYSLFRGLGRTSYHVPYSREAEGILFQLINEDGWDILSARIHSVSLKWLFQQENLLKSLCRQILKFCRSYSSEGTGIMIYGTHEQTVNVQTLAELVSSGDNCGARLFVCLLAQLVDEGGYEHDIIYALNLITTIVRICPAASDQLCLHGFGTAIRTICYSSHTFSMAIFMPLLVLVFNILSSVHSETISTDQCWAGVTMKVTEYSTTLETGDILTSESLFVLGILSLILHHSTNKALEEASKFILFNTCIVSMVNTVVHAASSKGPAFLDSDEETCAGETLTSVLLLNYFSLRSLHAILPGVVDWQNFLVTTNPTESLAFISIRCHELCRLLHFGSLVVKIVASYSLLELFNRISDQVNSKHEELKCSIGYLMSTRIILEGLVSYNDLRVATNCALCLSMIMEWEKQAKEKIPFEKSNWCRFIVEEMTVSLAAPCFTSQSYIDSQRPSVLVAIALLKLHKVPEWMRSVFNDSCISGILENLGASTLSTEIVVLFRELLKSDFLNSDHLATINQVLQGCRQRLSVNDGQDGRPLEPGKARTASYAMEEVCGYLIDLMPSETYLETGSMGFHLGNNSLLEEIELFFRTLIAYDSRT
ncbi:protein PUTATIVE RECOMBINATION INITIATION DEFECT 1 [Prosopis cineraria]|uniref:protein PUTATIVE RECOMBINATION INITIATION DEFECT 1 n=1 Tax=Prosopis cineraria TaxID=364024 RepID=UPI00240EA593|nr:protein PUTATIVE RECOMBINATION INITIATION DEFECT 1 [Prosopis cineraria]